MHNLTSPHYKCADDVCSVVRENLILSDTFLPILTISHKEMNLKIGKSAFQPFLTSGGGQGSLERVVGSNTPPQLKKVSGAQAVDGQRNFEKGVARSGTPPQLGQIRSKTIGSPKEQRKPGPIEGKVPTSMNPTIKSEELSNARKTPLPELTRGANILQPKRESGKSCLACSALKLLLGD